MDGASARRLGLSGLLLALLAAGVVARASDPTRASHDVAWTLHGGAILLDGGSFGVDVIDNNPPLVFWLGAAETALARALHAPALERGPALVLIDRTPTLAMAEPIDFKRYFSADPRFEEHLSRYRQLDSIQVMDGVWRKLDVYVRDPRGQAGGSARRPAS